MDKETRSKIMSRVKQKNTAPEIRLRKELHRLGLRYRLHDKKLPGTPDIIFPKFKAVLFVHGCFWHRHGCKATTTPGTNQEYWQKKFRENIARDQRNVDALVSKGWRVMIVWECVLKGQHGSIEKTALQIQKWLSDPSDVYSMFVSFPKPMQGNFQAVNFPLRI